MMMFFANFCAYYFPVRIRYFGCLKKFLHRFLEFNPTLRIFFSNPSVQGRTQGGRVGVKIKTPL